MWLALLKWSAEPRDGFPAVGIYDIKLAIMNHPGPQAGDGIDEGKVAAIVVGPMLGTNILSTSLIAWKAWYVLIMNFDSITIVF